MSDVLLRADIVKTLRDFEDDVADALLIVAKRAFELGEAAANPALLNRAREAEARAEAAEQTLQRVRELVDDTGFCPIPDSEERGAAGWRFAMEHVTAVLDDTDG